MQNILSLDSIGITVAEMEQSVEFFTQVLSFEKISDVEVSGIDYDRLQGLAAVKMRVVRLQLGKEILELTEYLNHKGKPIPADSRSCDLWFEHIAIVVSDIEQAYRQILGNVQPVSIQPQQIPEWNQAAAGIQAFKFRDPDGHNLELLHFPVGKGNPKWQQTNGQLFLGIDHTAIAISNTKSSVHFYDGLLGMKLASHSLNYGTEQDRLDHLDGARVLITSHQPTYGLGIEFLNYLQPTNARPIPPDTQSDNLVHWQIRMVVRDAAVLAQRLQTAGVRFVSSGLVLLSDNKLGFNRGFQILDPDGHAIQIVEEIV